VLHLFVVTRNLLFAYPVAWLGIALSHYRFRRAFIVQGRDLSELPYRAKLFPFGPVFAFALCLLVIAGQNYQAFIKGTIDWYAITVSYIGIPAFLLLWFGYKVVKKTKIVPLNECQLD
jgi:lysine-specific permease